MSTAPADVDRLVGSVASLPRLPAATLRLLTVINDPRSTVRDIVEIIKYDQAVTAELLRLVNSASLGLVRKIHSVDEAVCYLGTTKVMQILFAAHTTALLGPAQSGYGLRPGALWSHSVGVAIGAQQLARRLRVDDAGMLFTAGLLHDMGKVVFNESVDANYAAIAERVTMDKCSFCEAEQRVLGFTHAELGARVAERWRLPDSIIECIRHHHDPDPVASLNVDIVHLADSLCLMMGIGGADDGLLYRATAGTLARLGLSDNDIAQLSAELVCEFKSVQGLFRAPGA
ncbi:MAG: HDOD domain-containing protein [Phycisphaerales bacterium]|nr:HDOD domain-containing protein [Phycisphaerales bacterium]